MGALGDGGGGVSHGHLCRRWWVGLVYGSPPSRVGLVAKVGLTRHESGSLVIVVKVGHDSFGKWLMAYFASLVVLIARTGHWVRHWAHGWLKSHHTRRCDVTSAAWHECTLRQHLGGATSKYKGCFVFGV